MGGAILEAWQEKGLSANQVTVIKPTQSKLPGDLQSQPDYPENETPDLVLLAMKPYQLNEVAGKLAPLVAATTTIVSVLAGTETDILGQAFPEAGIIVRLMPNMAVTVGKSPMIFLSASDSPQLRDRMGSIFGSLGDPEWLENEDQMHLATALSGSGPAFLFRFIDALVAGAQELGMERTQAERLAVAMVDGAATLAAVSDLDPGALANQVAGRGGTTRKGLEVMDENDRANTLMKDVLEAAANRNREMAEEAKN